MSAAHVGTGPIWRAARETPYVPAMGDTLVLVPYDEGVGRWAGSPG